MPFRRIPVEGNVYFSRLIYYIHANPQRHGLIDDFREYPYSSYHSHLSKKATKLNRKEVIQWFGDVDSYQEFHDNLHDDSIIHPVVFDDF